MEIQGYQNVATTPIAIKARSTKVDFLRSYKSSLLNIYEDDRALYVILRDTKYFPENIKTFFK